DLSIGVLLDVAQQRVGLQPRKSVHQRLARFLLGLALQPRDSQRQRLRVVHALGFAHLPQEPVLFDAPGVHQFGAQAVGRRLLPKVLAGIRFLPFVPLILSPEAFYLLLEPTTFLFGWSRCPPGRLSLVSRFLGEILGLWVLV